jgi:sulfite reductase alpha subunit-like flavoprotein
MARRAVTDTLNFAHPRDTKVLLSDVKLAIVYYSATGTIRAMAQRAAQAGEKAGAEVRLRQVPRQTTGGERETTTSSSPMFSGPFPIS